MSFQWVGSSTIRTQQRSLRDYSEWDGSMFLKLNWGLMTEKTRLSGFIQNPQRWWRGLLRRTVWPVRTPTNISAMSYSPRFCQKSEQLMQRESRTSGELLLPVSRRPSHRERTSQRINEAPSGISNRTSPRWFTWQTVALLLCDWIVTQYHAMTQLIKIAMSQFSKGDQTNNISQEPPEKLHKLGPCQRLLTTKSDMTKITT